MSDREKTLANFCFPLGCFIPLVLYILIVGIFIGYVIANPINIHEFVLCLVALVAVAVWASITVGVTGKDE